MKMRRPPRRVYYRADGQIVRTWDRFWSKVRKTRGCWLWTGGTHDFGYGVVRINKQVQRAHVVSWLWSRGAFPAKLCVLHKCDQPACVRPSHLFLGTKADNSADMVRKGRQYTRPVHTPKKLGARDVVRIRRDYAAGRATQAVLGTRYGVSQVMIGFIVRREQWQHI